MKKFFLILLMMTTQLMAETHQMTLYFIPSPLGLDWSSPPRLAWSALKNKLTLKSHFMGHVFVEVQCGQERDITGMIGRNFDYLNQVLIEQRGLGVLYHSFDGQLEEKAEVDEELKDLIKNERVNFVTFNLNEGQCLRVTKYLKEYRAQNVGRYYGLANRPLYGEGAGCSAFGASFLEVAGVLDQEIKESWSNTVNIPLELAGPPLTDKKVSFFKVLFGASKWASPNESHKALFFWEPDLMYRWVSKKINQGKGDFTIKKIQNASGIVMDKSHLPAPMGPIWRRDTSTRPVP